MLLPRLENTNIRRLRRQGSPRFSVSINDIPASANCVYGFEEDPKIRKFLPLNFLRILNKSGVTLKIYVGQTTDGEIILDDTSYESYGNFYTFNIENISDTTTATGSGIYTTVQRKTGG